MKFKISGGKLNNDVVSVSDNGYVEANEPKKKDNKVFTKEEPVDFSIKDERPKNKKVEEAIEIDPSLIKDNKPEEKSLFEKLGDIIDELAKFEDENTENKKSIDKLILSLISSHVDSLEECEDIDAFEIREFVKIIGELYTRLYDLLESKIGEDNEDDLEIPDPEFPIENMSLTFKKSIIYRLFNNDNFDVGIEKNGENNLVPYVYYNIPGVDMYSDIIFNPIKGKQFPIEDYLSNDDNYVDPKDLIPDEVIPEEDNSNKIGKYGDIVEYAAEIINVKDVLPYKDPKRVLVLLDDDGEYITIGEDEDLLVIDKIDDKEIEKLTLVSKSWFDEVMEKYSHDSLPTGVVDTYDEKEFEDETEDEDYDDSIVIPPSFSVNGVVDED